MRSNSLIAFAFLSGAYAKVLHQPAPVVADPTITPAPRIPAELLRRQNDERFMGWLQYSSGAEWSSEDCDVGGTLYQSGDIWRCCSTTANGCGGPVGCVSGSLIYDFGTTGTMTGESTYACSEVYTGPSESIYSICNTGFLFENTEDSSPQTNVFCGITANNWSYYRQKPADPTSSAPSSSASTTITPDNDTPLTASPDPSGTNTVTPVPSPTPQSKAWIAGAVVGPVVGLALIGLGIVFLLRRRKNKKAAATAGAAAGPGGAAPAASYPGSPQTGPQGAYYTQMAQNQGGAGFVPYGVGVAEQKPQSNTYAYNAPQSPNSHGSGSPMPGSPQPQGYQHVEGPGSPQMLDSHLSNPVSYPQGATPGASPPLSPGPGQTGPNTHPDRPFSSELDSNERVPQVHPVRE